jgi:outer membrane receptor protein involved in Fe transport
MTAALAALCAPAAALAQDSSGVEEVIVTAQRRSENIRTVPISITSYSTQAMDKQGIRQIEDISRLTPSLQFTRTSGVAGNNGANISIRGIASDVGAATTAIYIDDTPIQIRSVGYFGGNPYPRIFDLDRVEVLRGPQGTLFGAGAEGGAVRFITAQPNTGGYHAYARGELSTTKNGARSVESGLAVGGPLSDTLAFRASAWYRRDGGYIDRVVPQTTTVLEDDINAQNTQALRAAVTWTPIPQLSITPSIYYQAVKSYGRDQYWETFSNIAESKYVTGISSREPASDKFLLPALKVQYDMGKVSLISNTSYFDRTQVQNLNYINYQSFLRTGNHFGVFANKDVNNSNVNLQTGQKNWTQEVRLQSFEPERLIDWTVGVYFADTKQRFTNLTGSGRIPGVISSGFPQYQGRYNLFESVRAGDKQLAGFASVDIKPMEGLKITLGGRVTRNKFDFYDLRDGPVNSGVVTVATSQIKETAFTPKVGVSYQINPDNMIYASASKGFRPGGGQLPVDPGFCATDLATLGLTQSPTGYDSDSLWSYEAGSKNRIADGKLFLDVNAYYVKWKNIQQSIRLPTCSFSYVDNLGSATGKGADLSVTFNLTPSLHVGANVGYNDTTFDDTILGGRGLVLREKGDRIGGPHWTGSLFGEGEWAVSASTEAYLRADYSFRSNGITPNPRAFGYDPGLPGLPSTDYMSLRAGLRFANIDLSAFVNNLTNSKEPISRSDDGVGSTLYYAETYRPRTFGLTMQIRY